MQTITVRVPDKLLKRIARMAVEEPVLGGISTITRQALEKEVARHEAKMKKIRDHFMQDVA